MWRRRGNKSVSVNLDLSLELEIWADVTTGSKKKLTFLYCFTWCGGDEAMCLFPWNSRFFKYIGMSRRHNGIQTQLTFLNCITWCGGVEAVSLFLWTFSFLWKKRHEQKSQRDTNTDYISVLRHLIWRRGGNVSVYVNLQLSRNIEAWADVTAWYKHSLHFCTASPDVEETRQCVCFCETPNFHEHRGMSRRHSVLQTQLTFLYCITGCGGDEAMCLFL